MKNGKRSRPINGLKHDLSANTIILTSENPREFDVLRQGYLARFQPLDPVEVDLVDRMVVSQWFLRRAWRVETALLDHSMDMMEPEIKTRYSRIDMDTRLALGFKDLTDNSKSLAHVQRYMTAVQRNFDHALAQLRLLRSEPLLSPPGDHREPQEILQIEPGDEQVSQSQHLVNEETVLALAAACPVLPSRSSIVADLPLSPSPLGLYMLPSAAAQLDFRPRPRRSLLR